MKHGFSRKIPVAFLATYGYRRIFFPVQNISESSKCTLTKIVVGKNYVGRILNPGRDTNIFGNRSWHDAAKHSHVTGNHSFVVNLNFVSCFEHWEQNQKKKIF